MRRFVALGTGVIFASCAILLTAAETNAGADPRPKIFRDWEKRRMDVAMVAYKFSGTRTWHRGGFTPPDYELESENGLDESPPFGRLRGETNKSSKVEVPRQDITALCDYDVTFDFQNNRCRVLRDDASSFPIDGNPALLTRYKVLEAGCAGVSSSLIIESPSGDRTQPKVDFMISKGDSELIPPLSFDYGYWPLFFGSGVVPTGDRRVKTVLLAPTNDPGAFIFDGYSTEQGRRCAILRAEYRKRYSQTWRYWIDLERDAALVKYTMELGDLFTTCSITNGLISGRWLPQSWLIKSVRGRKLQMTEAMTVAHTTLFTNISSDVFVLKPTVGMFVQEYEYYREPVTGDFSYREYRYRLLAGGERADLSGRFYHYNEGTGRIREGVIP